MQAMDDDVADDKSLLIVLVETNPRYWESDRGKGEGTAAALMMDVIICTRRLWAGRSTMRARRRRTAVDE